MQKTFNIELKKKEKSSPENYLFGLFGTLKSNIQRFAYLFIITNKSLDLWPGVREETH